MGILAGKAAVVTGGGRGIGRGHCLQVAEQAVEQVADHTSASLVRDFGFTPSLTSEQPFEHYRRLRFGSGG